MAPDDSAKLRARIATLSDPDLTRMLTREADNYRDEALAFAREEVARRGLDLAVAASESEWGSHAPRTAAREKSFEVVAPPPVKTLARFYVASLVLVFVVLYDIGSRKQTEVEPDVHFAALILVNLIGLWEYLRIVRRLHLAAQIATDWKYPVTPPFSVVAHFVPLYNIYFSCTWPAHIAHLSPAKGAAQTFDMLIPCTLNLLGIFLGFYSVGTRFALFYVSIWYVQWRLVRRTAGLLTPEERAQDWSSSAKV